MWKVSLFVSSKGLVASHGVPHFTVEEVMTENSTRNNGQHDPDIIGHEEKHHDV